MARGRRGGAGAVSGRGLVYAVTGRLGRLLRPRSLAFVGGAAAELAIDACRSFGFSGDMWAVNPRRELRGLPTLASAAELPFGVDAAFVGVERHAAVEVVRELAAVGTGAAVCHASGFAEAGETGAALQSELVAASAGMRLIGPNCYGTLSAPTGAALWPDVHGLVRCDRGVALLSQSGNIAVNLTMQRRGLDVAWVVTLGNQADVGISEAFEAVVADEAATGVGLCIEGLDDVERFVAASAAARSRGLPVVALKLGASESSGAIAVTHTASLVGDDTAHDALFDRLGIRRVHTLPELLDTLAVLCALGPLEGTRLVSLSCSGGEAAMVADRSRRRGLSFPPFAPDHASRVAAALDGRVAITNPLDYHTFIWGDEARLAGCFGAALGADAVDAGPADAVDAGPADAVDAGPADAVDAGPADAVDAGPADAVDAGPADAVDAGPADAVDAGPADAVDAGPADAVDAGPADAVVAGPADAVDAGPADAVDAGPADAVDAGPADAVDAGPAPFDAALLMLDFPAQGLDRSRWWPTLQAFAAACTASSTPGVVATSMAENLPEEARARAAELGLATCGDLDAALAALEAAAAWGQAPPGPDSSWPAPARDADPGVKVVPEHEAKPRLAAAGMAVPAGMAVAADRAAEAAAEIGYPVVVKAIGPAHKTETGAVVVGLSDSDAVAAAARRLTVGGDGAVMVESCVTDAVAELLVGVRSAPPVGMLLTLGAGGTLTELVEDTASLLLPVEAREVLEALQGLRVWPLLAGHRGRPPAAVEAVVEAVAALGALVREDRSIIEVEINPLMVTPHSAVAADALMLVTEPAPSHAQSPDPGCGRRRADARDRARPLARAVASDPGCGRRRADARDRARPLARAVASDPGCGRRRADARDRASDL